MSSSRWLAVGSAVLGVGALLAISWLVYVEQAHTSFWSWPGTAGIIIGSFGVLMLLVGFVMPSDDSPIHQVQRGGNKSVNLQAGRDLHLRDDKSER
jgi:hypothetical protein